MLNILTNYMSLTFLKNRKSALNFKIKYILFKILASKKKTYCKIDKTLNTDNIKKAADWSHAINVVTEFRLLPVQGMSSALSTLTWGSLLCSGLLVALPVAVSHRRHLDWKDSKHERQLWVPVPQDSVKHASIYEGVFWKLGVKVACRLWSLERFAKRHRSLLDLTTDWIKILFIVHVSLVGKSLAESGSNKQYAWNPPSLLAFLPVSIVIPMLAIYFKEVLSHTHIIK